MSDAVIRGYAAAAAELIPKYEAVSPAMLFAPVRHLLPDTACDVIDIGAGSGRDAGSFARQGHRVLAVEPVAAFVQAGRAQHGGTALTGLMIACRI